FAYFLRKEFNVIIYEKTSELGGLIATRYNLENIPWQQVPAILHTNKDWIVNLLNSFTKFEPVEYQVGMNPLFDFRYYSYPFNKKTIDTMPWHWKEAILQDLETSNGENAETIEQLITNFYGETIYSVFYENYFKRIFNNIEIDLVDWYRPWMRDVNTNFNYYNEKYILFPINNGWNKVINGMSQGVQINYNTNITISEIPKNDIIICTGDIEKFLKYEDIYLYSYGSFDIDSTPYKKGPDTIIYPNYTPFIQMTQYGKYYPNHEKNIIVKMFIDDGDIPLYPIPTKNNQHIYKQIVEYHPNVIFAGRAGSWSFMDIDGVIEQAQKVSAQIKHSRRNK
ncbi:MAG: hypothetical protein ACOC3V_05775, partial [bacterium]